MYNHLLHTFIQVADSESFAKAAVNLYISPVSVMKQINTLEENLGIKLLERTSHGVFLTAAGESIYRDAKRIIAYSDDAIRRAQHIAGIQQYTIRIGTSILRPCQDLINLWNSIDHTNLPFHFELIPFNDDSASLNGMLDSLGQTIDCFVGPCDLNPWHDKYSIEVLGNYPCELAVSRSHRLARKKKLRLEELTGETIGLLRPGLTSYIDQIRTFIQKNYPEIHVKDLGSIYDLEVFNDCEQQKYFIESLPVWQDIHPNLVTIPVDWDFTIPYGIVYAKQPSKAMKKFINEIVELKQ
ncbi:LysR family transcriptional regulator [Lactobacillus sp.]|uniref:LysR family transcriptional regulator n=1 Tax=Lactobacillus sp. TaxID=1591 RepID=UPI00199DF788|nr:LysR family transcriptional regulator [Lactobacillus sp.]MBD5429530.1 LysR family transcriptional regulator [Lactobacillus sp.]